jgi:UDP-glucose 4-epimerase
MFSGAWRKGYQVPGFSSSCTVYGQLSTSGERGCTCPASRFAIWEHQTDVGKDSWKMPRGRQDKGHFIALLSTPSSHDSPCSGNCPWVCPINLFPISPRRPVVADLFCGVWIGLPHPRRTAIRDYLHVVDLAKAHVRTVGVPPKRTDAALGGVQPGTGQGASVWK